MSKKRKDSNGRLLRTGEIQRKDLTYMYCFTNTNHKRITVYARDLKTLHRKEERIQKSIADGLHYSEGDITVAELLERYIELRQGVRYSTKQGYKTVLKLLQRENSAAAWSPPSAPRMPSSGS